MTHAILNFMLFEFRPESTAAGAQTPARTVGSGPHSRLRRWGPCISRVSAMSSGARSGPRLVLRLRDHHDCGFSLFIRWTLPGVVAVRIRRIMLLVGSQYRYAAESLRFSLRSFDQSTVNGRSNPDEESVSY